MIMRTYAALLDTSAYDPHAGLTSCPHSRATLPHISARIAVCDLHYFLKIASFRIKYINTISTAALSHGELLEL